MEHVSNSFQLFMEESGATGAVFYGSGHENV